MAKMDTQQALDIKSALITLAKALGMTPEAVASKLCFLSSPNRAVFIKASELWNEFSGANIVKQGKMLGLTVEVTSKAELEVLQREFEESL